MKKGRCPNCHKPIKGLYENVRRKNPGKQWMRRAFYCWRCDLVLKDDEIVFEKKIYEKEASR